MKKSTTVNLLTSLLFVIVGVLIFVLCPILKAGDSTSLIPLEFYEFVIENTESIKIEFTQIVVLIILPLSLLLLGVGFKGIIAGGLGLVAIFMFKSEFGDYSWLFIEDLQVSLNTEVSFSVWGIVLIILNALSIIIGIFSVLKYKK